MMRLKVLVSAYACAPDEGSEPGVGWNWVKQIARFHDVWVLTRENTRDGIDRANKRDPMPNVHWIFFDLPQWARFWKKGQRGVHLYYYLWQIGAYLEGKRWHRRVGFELVHHLTFVNYWLPSFVAFLPAIFVWGPVGGGESTPTAFYPTFSMRGRMYEYIRRIARWIGEHDPFVRKTAMKASIALATTEETAQRMIAVGAKRVTVLSQVALPAAEISALASIPRWTNSRFCILSLGRLLHLKGFHLGLKAYSNFVKEFPSSEYWFIGDGPESKNLRLLSRDLHIEDKVKFWGPLPREEAFRKFADCDILMYPSLHDSGGWACAEAMASGMPVICLDLGGPALQIDNVVGVKIPAQNPDQVVKEITEALLGLAQDPVLRVKKGEEGRLRVRKHFSWDQKGEYLNSLYLQAFSLQAEDKSLNLRDSIS